MIRRHRATRRAVRRGATALATLVLVAATGACSSSSGNDAADRDHGTTAPPSTTTAPRPSPKAFAAGDRAFRTVPDPIPTGTHGDLLRYQPVDDPPDGLKWYRIMYLSTTPKGKPTVETGLLTVPDRPTPTGGWKLATHAHGSTGLADDCAPSRTVDEGGLYSAEQVVVGKDAAASGYVVASTDYEGQGGPGRHPFLDGTSEGRSVLDAARAARQFPGLDLPTTLAIVGYSQGGHAALWANQLASSWTPEFHVTGTLAGAPASEVAGIIEAAAPTIADNGQAVAVMAGLAAADPSLDGDLDTMLTPGGKKFLAVMDASCTPPTGYRPETPLLTGDPLTTQPWKKLFAANTPGSKATDDPVLTVHSKADESVPIAQSATLLQRLCAHGQVVERRVLPEGSHVAAAVPAYEQGFAWLDGLTAGKKPVSSCPS